MITFATAPERYKPENGDLLWGATSDWAAPDSNDRADWVQNPDYRDRVSGLKLNVLDGTELDNDILLMCHINPNPMKAMDILEIDRDFFCPYKDPYTGYAVFGIIPTAILSAGWQRMSYMERCEALDDRGCRKVNYIDLAFDSEFVKETYSDHFELTEIQKQMMGSGYTSCCNMHDGHGSRVSAKVKMSNGDWLFVWVWEWYNK